MYGKQPHTKPPSTLPAIIVTTATGKQGLVYDGTPINGKVKVVVIDKNGDETGERLLCKQSGLTFVGIKD